MTLLEKELKRIIRGDVLFDEITRNIYSFGASIYKIKPKGVVIPKDENDLVTLVKYAYEKGIPLTARGACTSLAGQALGSGIIIDFTKYMNRIINYEGADTVTVEPGVVYGELNRFLKKFGKFLPPDPSSGDYCTIGGMIANNSGGPHSVKYGSMIDWCQELEVVLSTGKLVRLKQSSTLKSISEPLLDLFRNNRENIERYTPKVKRSASGYNVYGVMKDDSLDLVKLIVGSEGTLAIVTQAKLKLADLPKYRSVSLLFLKDINLISDIIAQLQNFSPAAMEFMDGTFIKLAREVKPSLKEILPSDSKGVLLVELEGDSESELKERTAALKKALVDETGLISAVSFARDKEEEERLWDVRQAAVPITNRIKGNKRPIPFIEDAIVPPDKLGLFILGVESIFSKYGVETCVYGHAGDGNVHIRPLLDMKDRKDIVTIDNMADEFYRLVISLGGSTTAEHGDGILRTPYLRRQFGPLYNMFAEIKEIFDPKGILNPGKKIGNEESITHDLVYDPDTRYIVTKTVFDLKQVKSEIEKCHACGLCRNVCPVNLNLPQEAASPRAKAAILRAIISGELEKNILLEKPIKDILELCVNCKSCKIECPTGADISLLCSLAKENYVNRMGVTFSQAMIEDMRFLGAASSRVPNLSNIFLRTSLGRFLIESALGIDRRRLLPYPSIPIFEKKRFSRNSGRRKVAYFYGCYVNFYNADKEGLSVMKVLNKNNIEVVLPPQRCCGIPSISSGNVGAVKKDMAYNIKQLYNAVKQGFDIVTSCPSCSLALKEDYPRIVNTAEAIAVAQKTFDIHEYLWFLFNEGVLNTDFKSSTRNVVFHAPCHLKAQEIGNLPECLAKLIPGITISKIENSCCGMAGAYGFRKKNYDLSMAIGRPLFEEIKKAATDLVITPCGACKTQIVQATSSRIIHPVELLAEYYS